MKKNGFTAAQVKEVEVRVAAVEASIVNNRDIPDICLQHMLAVMLLDKTVTFKSAHDVARMKDAATLAQRAKVQLRPDQELDKLIPKRVAIVTVKLADGKTFSERVENVRGTADNPMSREEVVAKARDLIVPVLGGATSQKLIDTVFAIERVKNVVAFRPLIAKLTARG
jgi:2-methylcitrate dehydratase PrpD